MALFFMDGFSGGDSATKWLSSGSRQTTSPRLPGCAYMLTLSSTRKAFTAVSELYVGVGINTNNTATFSFSGDGGVTTHLTFTYTLGTGLFSVSRGGTTLATGTTQISPNTWHYIEMHMRISDTVGIAEMRIDGSGTNEFSFSGDTKNGGTNASVDTFTPSSSSTLNIADVYMCDTTGTTNNSWLGDVVVRTLVPNGNGAFSQLVGSDSDSVNNYLLVNEQPVSSTQYVGSPTTGQHDSYTMGDLPTGATNVLAVQLNTYMAKSDATAASGKPFIRTSSTNYYGATRLLGTSYQTYTDVFSVNPNTGITWTVSDVNGLETGMEVG